MNAEPWIVFVVSALFAALDWRALILSARRGVVSPGNVIWVALWTGVAIATFFVGWAS